jgi:ketosteroid isomerase-like protein
MRGHLLFAVASITVLCVAAGDARHSEARISESTTDSVQEEIKKIELERNHAILTGDAAALDRMTSPDYTFINQRGELRTKTEILDGFKSGAFQYGSRDVSDLMIRVYGNTAVVTGRAIQKGTENTKDYSGENRFTRVYVKQGGRWVSVALQVTLVARP